MEDDSWLPRIDEPMAEYLKSDRYRKASAGITFSEFEGQEEANYSFWRHLTPTQRFELHIIMISNLYADELNKNFHSSPIEIVFTDNKS